MSSLSRVCRSLVKQCICLALADGLAVTATAQVSFPVNGIHDPSASGYAFINATVVKDADHIIPGGTMLIREGRIIAIGKDVAIPADAVTVDCKGKYIYPSFLDLYSNYGTPAMKKAPAVFTNTPQFISNTKGAYGWNQAIKSEVNAGDIFIADTGAARKIRGAGFGALLTHQRDGIARGTGAVVTPGDKRENLLLLKEKAAAFYSFDKGSSTQTYPFSLMGAIALLRQTFLDAQWYKSHPEGEGKNLSLEAWNAQQQLLQIFEVRDKWDVLRADKVGDEFGVQYIIRAAGNEYQRIAEMKATKATFILPVNFPAAMDVEDPNESRSIALSNLKQWEMAPGQPAAFEKAGITFCFTADGLTDYKQFLPRIRKAITYGLSEKTALEALTTIPAGILGLKDKLGSLDVGKMANFLITSGPLFNEKTIIYQNWVQGVKYAVNEDSWNDLRGIYTFAITGIHESRYTILVKGSAANPELVVIAADTLPGKISVSGKLVRLSFPSAAKGSPGLMLSGIIAADKWYGTGKDTNGVAVNWQATQAPQQRLPATAGTKKTTPPEAEKVYYPFNGYGWDSLPAAKDLLIRNATVWTNEREGVLENTDVLIRNGKIAGIGKGLSAAGARVIDGTGKHLTAGIIDEHSHITVTGGVNEGSQAITAEVRIGDVLNPEDVNIYRQLGGGVTAAHILHGSSNPIGGQSQLIKLRWGADAEHLKFAGWDPFIKFALGENVKHANRSDRPGTRFPQTRMGVEQLLIDAFTRAREYAALPPQSRRKDLELDALAEILQKKRFITCHSYVQSEISMLMEVAQQFGFTVNTFTHIIEGYKVADKMKVHGAGAGTFSDWWAYKMEVIDGIPYNANIMQQVGVLTAINSDNAEMARRLNQEAAKSIKYGGMPVEDALKMVTLNPARLLHVADRVGSIKVGKDADVVLWSDKPLSVYAKTEKTIVDGIIYFDHEHDLLLRQRISAERNRLIRKMLEDKNRGVPVQRPVPTKEILWDCEDEGGYNNLITGY